VSAHDIDCRPVGLICSLAGASERLSAFSACILQGYSCFWGSSFISPRWFLTCSLQESLYSFPWWNGLPTHICTTTAFIFHQRKALQDLISSYISAQTEVNANSSCTPFLLLISTPFRRKNHDFLGESAMAHDYH
jgi:hypothetical protein